MSSPQYSTAASAALALALAGLILFSPAALAQRTDENVTAQSDDAFGRSVGNESIGIYNSGEVRGFSPVDAGNARLEGLYFDRQTSPTSRLIEGSSIRVGIAAQSYPFPSPTGIVDYDQRRVGDERVVSAVLVLEGHRDSGGSAPNVTATIHATKRLAVYGSYTEGLEESPVAPSNAVNRNVAAPALETEQYDAGIRFALPGNLKLIAGVFNVEKPYFDLDAAGFFTQLGTVQHRGIELSLAGSPVKNLTLVAGTRFLDASVSGPIVDAGLIGTKPVGSARNYSIASLDYVLAGTGISFDAIVESISRQVADTANTVDVPGRAVLHLGSRYRFKLFGKPATLRAQVNNVFDRYGWSVVSSGVYVYNAPQRFTLYLAADL